MLLKTFGLSPEVVQETIANAQASAKGALAAMVEIRAEQKVIREQQSQILAKLEAMENVRAIGNGNDHGSESGDCRGVGSTN